MLLERYESVNLFDIVSLEHNPVLDELDRLLEEDALFQAVKADLAQRYPHTLDPWAPLHTGRSHVADAGRQAPVPLEL